MDNSTESVHPDTLRSLERKGIWVPDHIKRAMCNLDASTIDLILGRLERDLILERELWEKRDLILERQDVAIRMYLDRK